MSLNQGSVLSTALVVSIIIYRFLPFRTLCSLLALLFASGPTGPGKMELRTAARNPWKRPSSVMEPARLTDETRGLWTDEGQRLCLTHLGLTPICLMSTIIDQSTGREEVSPPSVRRLSLSTELTLKVCARLRERPLKMSRRSEFFSPV